MAIFEKRTANKVLIDDTEALSCVIENWFNTNGHTVSGQFYYYNYCLQFDHNSAKSRIIKSVVGVRNSSTKGTVFRQNLARTQEIQWFRQTTFATAGLGIAPVSATEEDYWKHGSGFHRRTSASFAGKSFVWTLDEVFDNVFCRNI